MPISYSVQADVIDIAIDAPKPTDSFLVDTNVWYWLTYPAASSSAHSYQVTYYPNYIQAAITAGSVLYCSGLSFAELAHLIEKAEHRLSSYSSVTPKGYRHNYPLERAKVVSEVQTAWNIVTSGYASQINCTVDEPTVSGAVNRFQTQALDGYDLFILEAMRQHSIVQVITDDGDYATVPGIQVFSANRNVITTARNQGKLTFR